MTALRLHSPRHTPDAFFYLATAISENWLPRTKSRVHGFLWVVDEIHQNRLSPAKILCAALRLLAGDPAVRLPRRELAAYIKRYESLR